MKPFVTTSEVAQLLDLSDATFRGKRAGLIADHAFPRPMPHSLRPLRWRRDQVMGWIEDQGGPPAPPQDATYRDMTNVALLREARRA